MTAIKLMAFSRKNRGWSSHNTLLQSLPVVDISTTERINQRTVLVKNIQESICPAIPVRPCKHLCLGNASLSGVLVVAHHFQIGDPKRNPEK
jgi:hypothetical protein